MKNPFGGRVLLRFPGFVKKRRESLGQGERITYLHNKPCEQAMH